MAQRDPVSMLLTVAETILAARDLDTTIAMILEHAREQTGARVAGLLRLDPDSGILQYTHSVGLDQGVVETYPGIRLGAGVAGRALAESRPCWATDIQGGGRASIPPQNLRWAERWGIRAVLAAPLTLRGMPQGALTVHYRQPHDFAPAEVETLAALASMAAIALENARLYEATERRARQLATLNELSRRLTSVLDRGSAGQEILAAVGTLFPGAVGRLWEAVDDGSLRLVASSGLRHPENPGPRMFLRGQGVASVVAETLEPVVVLNVLEAPRFVSRAWATAEGLVSCVQVPLVIERGLRGILAIFTRTPRAFSQDEVDLLRSFAAQAAIVFENARLYDQATSRAERMARLVELVRLASQSLDVRQVQDLVVEASADLLAADFARLWLAQDGEDTLELAASGASWAREAAGDPSYPSSVPLQGSLLGHVATTRQPRYSPDLAADPLMHGTTWVARGGFKSQLAVPLVVGDRALGALALIYRHPREFEPDEIALLEAFAAQVAIVIDNARLHAAALRRAEELAALLRSTRAVMGGLDLQATLQRIVEEAARIADTPYVYALLVDQEAGVLRLGAATSNEVPENFSLRMGESFSGAVAVTGEPVFFTDVANDPRTQLVEFVHSKGIVSYLGLPIKARGHVVGVLVVTRTDARHYEPRELGLLTSFADQAAVAIENARLHQAAVEAARLESEARGRLEGVSLAARELAHLLNNDLSLPYGAMDLLQHAVDLPPRLRDLVDQAMDGLSAAAHHIRQLQQVVRVETKETPVGPALDLERSARTW